MAEKEVVDVGEEKQVKKHKEKYKLTRENELEDLKKILDTAFGSRFLWRIFERCHMYHSISGRDMLDMARASGERDIGLWLLDEINAADKKGNIKLILAATERENND